MVVGSRIGSLQGLSVYETVSEVYNRFEALADFDDLHANFFWLTDDCTLRYGGRIVGHVNRKGEVDDFKEELFERLRREQSPHKTEYGYLKNAEPASTVEEMLPDESPISEETAEVDLLLEKSRLSVSDLLTGFECTADKFLEELKTQK